MGAMKSYIVRSMKGYTAANNSSFLYYFNGFALP